MRNLITLNRQFGSGGREVGKRLADALNWSYYDKELLKIMAEETGFSEGQLIHFDEKSTRNYAYSVGRSFTSYLQPLSIDVQLALDKIIKDVAQKEDSIFIGRCSNYILRDQNPLKIFIYSSDITFRVERCFSKVPEDRAKGEKQMIKEILAVDKKRARYHEQFTGQNYEDMSNYNLCIDTSIVGIKGAVELIMKALEMKGNFRKELV